MYKVNLKYWKENSKLAGEQASNYLFSPDTALTSLGKPKSA